MLLEMKNIEKEFSGVYALKGIRFDLKAGEIHSLVGENGAGKSTLMKVLSGAYTPGGGSIKINGKEYRALTPSLSKDLGIHVIYQENDLVPSMNIVENIFIGSEISRHGFVDFEAMKTRTEAKIEELGLELDPLTKISDLSVSEIQFVKILKALATEPQILVMDEPTSMFHVRDAQKVLDLAVKIAGKGIGIVYISHFLEEVRKISDRITVIRDGEAINTYDNPNRDIDLNLITCDMVGRPLDIFYKKEKNEIGEVILEVKDLQLKKDSPKISFYLRRGEILGLSGMVGSGRTEIVRALTGADPKYAGEILLNGERIRTKNPADSIKKGFAHITEDRQELGLALGLSVLENITVVGLRQKVKGFFMNYKNHVKWIEPLVERLRIKTPGVWSETMYLSGGNQQKVVLAKWLFADQNIYIFDEPTRGIDVNAKAEFYKEMSNITKQGKSIIMISSDMPELISMSDRILVIRKGGVDGELSGQEMTEENIIKLALGVS